MAVKDSGALGAATEHQPQVRAALTAAINGGASHAYLFHGPAGAGKREAARAFAAELLAGAVNKVDPAAVADTRRRALLDPSPHPDLVWIAPDGLQHRVEEIRRRVIRLATRRPFEAGRRVFVIEQAQAMRDESQNALLKTLEEPPPYAHLILIAGAADELLPTVRSRCRPVEFAPLPAEVVQRRLARQPELASTPSETLRAASRLADGDFDRARLLASARGSDLRAAVELLVATTLGRDTRGSNGDDDTATHVGQAAEQPWKAILDAAEQAGAAAEGEARARIDESAELGIKLSKTESDQAVRREARRARTQELDLALDLTQYWLRDLSAISAGAGEVIHNTDRASTLTEQASLCVGDTPRAGLALVGDYRRRLRLNVSEELAFEALHSELTRTLHG